MPTTKIHRMYIKLLVTIFKPNVECSIPITFYNITLVPALSPKLTGDDISDPKVADKSTNETMGDILCPAASVLHLHSSVRDDPHNFGEPPRFDVLVLQSNLDDLADGIQLEGNGVCAAEALEGLSVSEDDVYLGTEPDFVDFGFLPLVHDKVLQNV